MMIALEARAPALNRLRPCTLAADQDLFGRWQAVVTLGRIERHDQAAGMPLRMRPASRASCGARSSGAEAPRAGSASATR